MSVPFTDINQLYIGGQWIAPDGGLEPIINPATEEPIGEAPVGGKNNVEDALAAAREAFDKGPWSGMDIKERAGYISHLRDAILRHAEQISTLLTAEVGATQAVLQIAQFQGALEATDYALELANNLTPDPLPVSFKKNIFAPSAPDYITSGITVHDAFGVVLGITPYNYPFLLNVVKAIPALLAGNTLILKPSPFTPFSALLLGKLVDEIGLPPGVFNIVTGDAEVGGLLTSDPRVDMISFTGSDAVGSAIMAQAAPTLKKLHLELGGKSAMIVCDDADLMKAAATAAFNFSLHAGQGCAMLTRYIVHNSLRPAFVEAAKAVVSRFRIGNPADPNVFVGPLIRESARARTERYVQAGLDEGATLVCGGRRPAGIDKGFFYEPTLFDGVDNRSTLAQDEIFGPVGVVIGFDTPDEAISMANDSRYGLNGAVFSENRAEAYRLACRMRTGGVGINGGIGGFYVRAPFGGYRHSGIGRELGPNWLKEYLQEKVITYPVG